jgi:hypothetical protein
MIADKSRRVSKGSQIVAQARDSFSVAERRMVELLSTRRARAKTAGPGITMTTEV